MRTFRIVVVPKALRDIQRAADYYNEQKAGLGGRFIDDLNHELSMVATAPFSRAIRYDDIRFAVLSKFPFAAHYYVEHDAVVVLAVISMFMDPETTWVKGRGTD